MNRFEEEFNYLIELSGKVLIGQVDAETFEKNRVTFFEKYNLEEKHVLTIVPDFIDKLIKDLGVPKDGEFTNYAVNYPENEKALDWIDKHQKTWLTALLIGYKVEKKKLFYLKDDLTGQFLAKNNQFKDEDKYFFWNGVDPLTHSIGTAYKLTFTQQEIDSMETRSYEQIEVTE